MPSHSVLINYWQLASHASIWIRPRVGHMISQMQQRYGCRGNSLSSSWNGQRTNVPSPSLVFQNLFVIEQQIPVDTETATITQRISYVIATAKKRTQIYVVVQPRWKSMLQIRSEFFSQTEPSCLFASFKRLGHIMSHMTSLSPNNTISPSYCQRLRLKTYIYIRTKWTRGNRLVFFLMQSQSSSGGGVGQYKCLSLGSFTADQAPCSTIQHRIQWRSGNA